MIFANAKKIFKKLMVDQFFHQQKAQFQTSLIANGFRYPCRKMIKDVKVRKLVQEHAFERMNINALRKAKKIIPAELKEICDDEMKKFPGNSSITRMHGRCMVTSRPRGMVTRWRLSRIAWRHVADYNQLSGVQRAMW